MVAVSALAGMAFPAQSEDAACDRSADLPSLEWRNFGEKALNGQAPLLLSKRGETFGLYFVRSPGRPCLGRIEADRAAIVNACRDLATGRVHTVIHTQSGASFSAVEIWSADPATGNPARDYAEVWGDMLSEGIGMEELVATDGTCVWPQRREARKVFGEAIAALRVWKQADFLRAFRLPTRILTPETVRRWLQALEGIATLEGALYDTDEDRHAWRVVQVFGGWACDAKGAVLLLDRETGVWRTIHDIPSGCMKTLNYPLRGMVVRDDRLFVLAGDRWRGYGDFVIDLRTMRTAPLTPGAQAGGAHRGINPPIRNLDREIFND